MGCTVGAATPAAAVEVSSIPVVWEGVDETRGSLDDGRFTHAGETMPGWTHDAFDGIGTAALVGCSGAPGTAPLVFTEAAPPVITHGGASVFSLTATGTVDAVNCGAYSVQLTMTLQGNFVRWDYTLSGDYDRLEFTAAIGSDSDGVYNSPDAATVLVSDSSQFSPSLALQGIASGPSAWVRSSNNIDLRFVAESPTSATVVAALADFTWVSGRAEADAHLASIAGSLASSAFGTSFPLFQGTDAPNFSEQQLTAGAATSAVAHYSYDPGLFRGMNYFDNAETGHKVQALVGAMPAGVTASVAYAVPTGAPVITVSGTPLIAGTYSVPVTFYQLETDDTLAKPLFSTLPITVAGAPAELGAAAPGGQLAHSGRETGLLLGGAASVAIAGAVLIYGSRRGARPLP